MAKATEAFHTWDDVDQRNVFYDVGDDVPDHIAARVSADVVDEKPETDDAGSEEITMTRDELAAQITAAADGREFTAADVEAKVAEALEAFTTELHQLAGDTTEDTTEADAPKVDPDAFDPGADGVRAADVAAYLKGLDVSTDEGRAEYDRVVAAEKAAHNDGQGRATALA